MSNCGPVKHYIAEVCADGFGEFKMGNSNMLMHISKSSFYDVDRHPMATGSHMWNDVKITYLLTLMQHKRMRQLYRHLSKYRKKYCQCLLSNIYYDGTSYNACAVAVKVLKVDAAGPVASFLLSYRRFDYSSIRSLSAEIDHALFTSSNTVTVGLNVFSPPL